MNKKFLYGALAVLAVVAIYAGVTYNGFVEKKIAVDKSWAQVENQYQRRFNLIPNLVEVVKFYAKHENEIFENVAKARTNASQVTVNIGNATDDQLAAFLNAQDQLGASLAKMTIVKESYPDLKANKNFEGLMVQLNGTENRIVVARRNYNKIVADYNADVRTFPSNVVANIFGFNKKPMYEADGGAENAVKVNLD